MLNSSIPLPFLQATNGFTSWSSIVDQETDSSTLTALCFIDTVYLSSSCIHFLLKSRSMRDQLAHLSLKVRYTHAPIKNLHTGSTIKCESMWMKLNH